MIRAKARNPAELMRGYSFGPSSRATTVRRSWRGEAATVVDRDRHHPRQAVCLDSMPWSSPGGPVARPQPDVAAPIHVFVLEHCVDELRAVSAEPSERIFRVPA